ncbi:PD-(D/E)XK nuclease family protein [Streptomyces sp. NPDC101490]|uniref:PD-(D/E)XK nuclease family protein n=1 Tax=Streptomyces sp. NPDC101490 TaxID=3366143 RepID=UPI003813170E
MRRTSRTITVSAAMFKKGELRCPAADALTARGYLATHTVPRRGERLEHFTLGPFMEACDARRSASSSGEPPRGRRTHRVHDALRVWTEHGLENYAVAFPEDQELREVDPRWTYRHRPSGPDTRAADEYRFTVWGRCLASVDGSLRELRLPVHRIGPGLPPAEFVAAAALVLAEGAPGPPPERVRIVEFALFDGRTRQLFDGSRAEALALYRASGRAALTTLLDSQEYRPGPSCGGCVFAQVCPALRSAPGLLGVTSTNRPRRTWSVTNGRNYRDCPARDHMRRLRLPAADAIERDAPAERGRALHAYLADRHAQSPLRPCTADVPDHWVPTGFDLPEHERALGVTLLRRHAEVCPLSRVADGTDVRTEPRVVRHDTAADVVVVAAPDLLYRDGESWVWRETKTSASDHVSTRPLLDRYPQLALAVLLVARGDLGGTRARARVELELLRPGGADLEVIDPFVPANLNASEKVLRAMVADWHDDDAFAPAPGRSCARCEMSRWCSAKAAVEEAA